MKSISLAVLIAAPPSMVWAHTIGFCTCSSPSVSNSLTTLFATYHPSSSSPGPASVEFIGTGGLNTAPFEPEGAVEVSLDYSATVQDMVAEIKTKAAGLVDPLGQLYI
mgnify:CR=1 FL=1